MNWIIFDWCWNIFLRSWNVMMFVTVSMCSIMHAVIHRKVLFNCCCFTIQKVSYHAGKQLDIFGELQLVVHMKRKNTPTDVDRRMYGWTDRWTNRCMDELPIFPMETAAYLCLPLLIFSNLTIFPSTLVATLTSSMCLATRFALSVKEIFFNSVLLDNTYYKFFKTGWIRI